MMMVTFHFHFGSTDIKISHSLPSIFSCGFIDWKRNDITSRPVPYPTNSGEPCLRSSLPSPPLSPPKPFLPSFLFLFRAERHGVG